MNSAYSLIFGLTSAISLGESPHSSNAEVISWSSVLLFILFFNKIFFINLSIISHSTVVNSFINEIVF